MLKSCSEQIAKFPLLLCGIENSEIWKTIHTEHSEFNLQFLFFYFFLLNFHFIWIDNWQLTIKVTFYHNSLALFLFLLYFFVSHSLCFRSILIWCKVLCTGHLDLKWKWKHFSIRYFSICLIQSVCIKKENTDK